MNPTAEGQTVTSLLEHLERVPVDAITPHPENARKGNVAAIGDSLAENHQFAPIIVQRSTGYVLAGNHTLLAARALGWPEVDAAFVDVDDDRARKIMLAANKTSDSSTYEEQALLDLLEALNGDYEGTGYTPDDLDDLLSVLNRMPEAPYKPTEAAYAETPEELEARSDLGSGMSLAARGIRETVIILVQDEHDELHRHLAQLRALIRTDTDLTNGELLLRSARALRLVCEQNAQNEEKGLAEGELPYRVVERVRTPL